MAIASTAFRAPDAMAEGRKTLWNHTRYTLDIVLVIRAGSDPRNVAGTQDVTLPPNSPLHVQYGNHADSFLNGIRIVATHDGERIVNEFLVMQRGSTIDTTLNSFGTLNIRNDSLFGWKVTGNP